MTTFMVRFDTRDFGDFAEGIVKAAETLLHQGDRLTGNRRKVGQQVAKIMAFDEALDAYLRTGGEAAEEVYTSYYYLKAVAFGMAGDDNNGRACFRKAKAKRSGGVYAEWCQDFGYR
jgi:hypothetical protein